MHDWKRVPPTIYHHFHQQWTIAICNALNAGLLPPGYSALVEQYSSDFYPNVLAMERRGPKLSAGADKVSILAAPRTRMSFRPRTGRFHERANQVLIHHHLGDVVCAIEIVSPGNKAGKIVVGEFVAKATDFLRRGVSLLIVDPFPPGLSDPQSLHKLIWDEFDEEVPFELPSDEPLLLASYRAAVPFVEFSPEAFIEPLRVGAEIPHMAAWLDPNFYVNVPLEQTYQLAWNVCPTDFRALVEHGALPDENVSS